MSAEVGRLRELLIDRERLEFIAKQIDEAITDLSEGNPVGAVVALIPAQGILRAKLAENTEIGSAAA